MGVGRIEAAVTDAGPLIHLTEIGCISALDIFQTLHVSDAVWKETVGQGRVPDGLFDQLRTVKQHTIPDSLLVRFIQQKGLGELHRGEQESLYLCHRIGVPLLLTDDLAVREAARQLHITPVGSLGIIIRTYRLGAIDIEKAEHLITALYEVSSLYVTRAIVEMAIEQLHHC